MATNTQPMQFDNADDCYRYFQAQRLKAYDAKQAISLQTLTKDVSEERRKKIISAIITTCNKLQTTHDTVFHAIRLFDIYISTTATNTENNEDYLKAATSILLSHKLIDAPKFSSFGEIIVQSFSERGIEFPATTEGEDPQRRQIQTLIQKEMEFFNFIGEDAFVATPISFLQLYTPLVLTPEQLELSKVLCLFACFSAEIASQRSEEIAKVACSLSCLLTQSEDVTEKIFGAKVDPKLFELFKEKITTEAVPDDVLETIGDINSSQLIEQIKLLQ